MTLTLSEKEKRAVAAIINERIDEHLSRFPYAKYPIEPLEEWKRIFCDPKAVSSDTLKQALGWHFGDWQRKDIALSHRKAIFAVLNAWPEFTDTITSPSADSIYFWEQKLPDWQRGYDATAFLLHLLRPDNLELTDHHRLHAMSELLKEINHQDSDQSLTKSLQDLERYTQFFRAVLPKLPGADGRVRLDRFLKAYGNRHAYKNITNTYCTKEPTIRQFTWNDNMAQRFDLKKITLRSNADILFACLLLVLDKNTRNINNLTIGQITNHIPLGTAGICNPASYHYAMIALFGEQKGRDFFIFEDVPLSTAFTEQANNSTRDMRFYRKYEEVKIKINPKYIMN
ncbi:hypothetical protein NYE27_01045 [Paenibacillus sp. FSL R10-2779]|uniref:hypothetical protein n=1 Tax=Paenibacillus sp. FSL R10-2779 TaxID=2975340 RepID=UPI0030FBB4E3